MPEYNWIFTLFIKKWYVQYYFCPFQIFQRNKIGRLHSYFLPRLTYCLEQMVLSIITFCKLQYHDVIMYCRFGAMQLSPHRASTTCSPGFDSGLALKQWLRSHSHRDLRRFTRLPRKLWILSMMNASKNWRNKLTSSSKRCWFEIDVIHGCPDWMLETIMQIIFWIHIIS